MFGFTPADGTNHMILEPPDSVKALKSAFGTLFERNDVTEPEIQSFLEENSELIPVPYLLNHDLHGEGIISKFELDRDKVPDFAYLTKSSVEWRLVLIELERPQKRLFIKRPHTDFHRDTRAAIAQIEDWKQFVDSHPDELCRRLRPLMTPLHFLENPIEVKYLLVIGQHPSITYTPEQSGRIKRLSKESNIQLCTYNSILRMGSSYRIGHKKNIFSHDQDRYKFKFVHIHYTNIFGWHTPDQIGINPEQIKWFESHGFDMQSWLKGKLLTLNGMRIFGDAISS